MCKAPNVNKQAKKAAAEAEAQKPEYLHNPYLDAAIGSSSLVSQLRTGRSSLRQDLDPTAGVGNVAPASSGGTGSVTLGLRGRRGDRSRPWQPGPDIGGPKLQPGGGSTRMTNSRFRGR